MWPLLEIHLKYTNLNIHAFLDWQFDEQSDVLLFKKLTDNDKNFVGNYMEIARRMREAGWSRNNNQCRQQVNNLSVSISEILF